jgi:hypothetical protein
MIDLEVFPMGNFENVTDRMPEQVDSIAIWQDANKKYNFTAAQATVLQGFAASLGPNFVAGTVYAVADPETGAPSIPLEVAREGFKKLGMGDPALNYQQVVRVNGPGGWREAVLEFGKMVERFRGAGSAADKVAAIQDILTGESTIGGGQLIQISQADFLSQIHDVQVAVDNACSNLIRRFSV